MERATPSDEDPGWRAMIPTYQKVLSNQSYTLRKRPAIMPTDLGKAAVVSSRVVMTRQSSGGMRVVREEEGG